MVERDPIEREYANGREDGIHEGTTHYDWRKDLIERRVAELAVESRESFWTMGRQARAYALGFARGYREAAL